MSDPLTLLIWLIILILLLYLLFWILNQVALPAPVRTVIIVVVALVVLVYLLRQTGLLTPSTVEAASEQVSDCVPFAKIGDTKLYRCVDEQAGYLCYLNPLQAGIIACMEY